MRKRKREKGFGGETLLEGARDADAARVVSFGFESGGEI